MKIDILKSCVLALLTLLSVLVPDVSHAVIFSKDTVWSGEVKVNEDILVPKGITLTILPGTVVRVTAAESTKTDPEYLSPLTEITIRGTLKVEGNSKAPVEIVGEENRAGCWAGIIVDQGSAIINSVIMKNADTALSILDGKLRMTDATIQNNRYGIVAQGDKADAVVEKSRITGNDYGVLTLQGAAFSQVSTNITGNQKKDSFSGSSKKFNAGVKIDAPQDSPVSRRYKDEVFRGDVVWQGHIEVAGMIRVPQGSRLIVLPGTVVEFVKRDTDGDGIGENGILVQGLFIAKGTKALPIIFRSAETDKKMGDWDSINIMDSVGAQNLIEYCRIEHAYRALHFHFSNVGVHNSFITNNYRGIQFQESQVDMRGNYLYANKSGVQGRDADITLVNNIIHNNYIGANFFRTTLDARGNSIVGNWREGWRIREGISTLQENLIDGNRQGLMLADMYYGSYIRNSMTNNLETGLSLRNVDNIEVSENAFVGNGINGLNIQESRALISKNQITDNGEQGIGIQSFGGLITENNFALNGRYAIDLDGPGDVDAPSNWWGGDDPLKVILDKQRDPSRGKVAFEKPSGRPLPFAWPLQSISTDAIWRGAIVVNRSSSVPVGVELKIAPKTTVLFSQGTGLNIKGRMLAQGTPSEKIVFTSLLKKGASDWDEIQLEYATGSVIANCIFEYATWGIHSHFTNLSISDSQFTNNYGGMRFRSGPVVVKHSVFDNNTIGIRAYLGNAVIKENVITKNETGIFVREKGGGLTISGNNIYDNSNYNIRVGDFNNEDVPARDNWWGTADPLATFFDARAEPGIGNVLFEPFRKTPFKLEMSTAP